MAMVMAMTVAMATGMVVPIIMSGMLAFDFFFFSFKILSSFFGNTFNVSVMIYGNERQVLSFFIYTLAFRHHIYIYIHIILHIYHYNEPSR